MTAMEVIGIQINTAKLLHYTDLLKVMNTVPISCYANFLRFPLLQCHANQLVSPSSYSDLVFFFGDLNTELNWYIYGECLHNIIQRFLYY